MNKSHSICSNLLTEFDFLCVPVDLVIDDGWMAFPFLPLLNELRPIGLSTCEEEDLHILT